MPRYRLTLLSLRDLLASVGPFVLLTLGLLWLAYWWLSPAPPARVILATGPEQSAYDTFGQRYAEALRVHGITVELLPSGGSADNIELLRSGRAHLAFVQGGSGHIQREDESRLQTLGNLLQRMGLAMGLIIALALPLSRILPPIYNFRIRSRVFRWYAELRDIETRAEAEVAAIEGLPHQLDDLEHRAEKISLPLAYTDELYALRHHIELVRQRLSRLVEQG